MTGRPNAIVSIFRDLGELSNSAAARFAELAERSILSSGRFAVALSGGSTPIRFYSLLAAYPFHDQIDWKRVHVFWVDERCVPPDHKDSNYHSARDAFLSSVPIPAGHIHRIRGEDAPDEAASKYEQELCVFFGTAVLPAFDLVVLGAGADGHTASLFPSANLSGEARALVLPVFQARPGHDRVTLSLVVLNQTRHALFLVSGSSKAEMVREIFDQGNEKNYPAGLVQPERGTLEWFLDQEAASAALSLMNR